MFCFFVIPDRLDDDKIITINSQMNVWKCKLLLWLFLQVSGLDKIKNSSLTARYQKQSENLKIRVPKGSFRHRRTILVSPKNMYLFFFITVKNILII